MSACVVVDVQNDFITGSLSLSQCPAGQDGAEVVPVINKLLDTVPFDLVVYTKDWHPENHISFIENVKQRPFTENCKVSDESCSKYHCIVIRDLKKIQIRSKLFWNYSQHCLFTFYFEVHFNTRDFLSYLLIQGHLSNLNCLPSLLFGIF